ncbi:unnamed protein product [Brachionus calyciflorus]|uniref:Uncharacterized protein n=1 Tax=Brachionus calyciflorus TaxID=104777 RepID=A0A813PC35_9BILA|nr:unnamed protein product [Brachionus calyciflorus]
MKINFTLILISLSVSKYHSVSVPSSIGGLRCVYSKNKVNCENHNEQDVECDAISNLDGLGSTLFNVFGIGALPKEYNYLNIENVFYYLYPRSLDESVYFNHSIRLNETNVDLTLFYSVESNVNNSSYGIRVIDKTCFENLVKLLRQVDDVKTVQVKQSLIGDGKQVDLVGEVIIENHAQKRHHYNRWRGKYNGYRGRYRYYDDYDYDYDNEYEYRRWNRYRPGYYQRRFYWY